MAMEQLFHRPTSQRTNRRPPAGEPLSTRPGERDREGGFTLVELLVVLVILSLLAGLIAPRVLSYLASSRERTVKLQIQSLGSALDLFYLDNGRYPSTSEGLVALVKRPPGAERWAGPYVQQTSIPPDPWGTPYEYRAPGNRGAYLILSLGSDKRKGGEGDAADISNEAQP
jgi:general secretion pathway protein G